MVPLNRVSISVRFGQGLAVFPSVIASPFRGRAVLRINSAKQSRLSRKRLLRAYGPRNDNRKVLGFQAVAGISFP